MIMNYKNFLPLAIIFLPLIKGIKGSRSVLPIPEGSKADKLMQVVRLDYHTYSIEGFAKTFPYEAQVYKNYFKDTMPFDLYQALVLSDQNGFTRNLDYEQIIMIGNLNKKKMSPYAFWMPFELKRYFNSLFVKYNTFENLTPEFISTAKLPNVAELNINYSYSENPSALTENTFLMIDENAHSDDGVRRLYIDVKPHQISEVINSLPDDLPFLTGFRFRVDAPRKTMVLMKPEDILKILSYPNLDKFETDMIVEGFISKFLINAKEHDLYSYLLRGGVNPEIIQKIFKDKIDFVFKDSELRKF